MGLGLLNRLAAAALCFSGSTLTSKAQTAAAYPTSPVHIIVGFAAGGGNDLIARVLADGLSTKLGQPVIIDNKAGAGGILAAEFVSRATPDGYTLLLGPSGSMSVNVAVYANLRYNTTRDFETIAPVSDIPLVLMVSSSAPIKSVQDLVDYTKANPSKANYGATSTSFQLVNEMFNQKSGAKLSYVPYKSTGEIVIALLSGEVTAAIIDLPPSIGQIKSGSLRPLAVTAATRAADLPDVPTLKELGLKDMEITFWNGLFAPKGTPIDVVRKLRDGVESALATKETSARYDSLSVTLPKTTAAEFPAMIAADIERWRGVAAAAHISLTE